MISWLITSAQEIGLLGTGFIGGVFFAAWRQLQAEEIADAQWSNRPL